MPLRLASIYRYPVKSARGHALEQAAMDRFGLAGDRRWMLVDPQGQFVSQRSLRRLALLEVSAHDQGLLLGFAGASCEVALPAGDSERVAASIWGFELQALPADSAVNDWLGAQLGTPLRLVYFPEDVRREVEAGAAPDPAAPRPTVGFADGYPLLVISEASLDALNARLENPVPMDRFRPNLVIAGAEPHAEDDWQTLQIGDSIVRLARPCSRCVIPSIDQQTAERDAEINRVLASYRRRDGVIYFGMNALADAGAAFTLGDPVRVLD